MTKVKVSEVLVSTWLGPKNIVRDVITCVLKRKLYHLLLITFPQNASQASESISQTNALVLPILRFSSALSSSWSAYTVIFSHIICLIRVSLVDAETCRIADSHKIDIVKQLGTVLQGEVKPSM